MGPAQSVPRFDDPITAKMAAFVVSIGIPIIASEVSGRCFVPGIRLERGSLVVDEGRMLYPGDLLHEAGHLAVMTPAKRHAKQIDASNNLGDEIAAIAWSWAALVHLGIAPDIVFHEHGYRGQSDFFIDTYGAGTFIGLPLLQWMGLTADPQRAAALGVAPFPHMLRWLRAEPEDNPPA